MILHLSILLLVLFLIAPVCAETMPRPAREFRAVWVATVDNIDFPTRKGLSVEEQKAEILKDLDLAAELKMNAVIFQVRPMADAIYASKIEPWSEFLTGAMGRAQKFDPLAFLCAEAHKRGILVHAWFNPYRAYHPAAKTVSPGHVTQKRPEFVRKYGDYQWLDPTDDEVKKYSLSVVRDVVRRYDIDGVHFDDYFYPYPITENGQKIDFPDEENWQEYLAAAARMSSEKMRRIPLKRDEWRRANVDEFIETVGREIRKIKPEIMYGISPIGVESINLTELYADAGKWLRDGTVDYLAPQLYWRIDRPEREFPLLLKFWEDINTKKRHVWAGIGTYKINEPKEKYSAREILDQILLTRKIQSTAGNIQFSFKSLRNDFDGIQKALRENVYQSAALIPASPWIKAKKPRPPRVVIARDRDFVRARWTETGTRRAFWFVVYVKDKNGWSCSVRPASEKSIALSADRRIEKILVTSVDRLGNESAF
ncbi:MAG: family 10 glycosylhydrolase [Acidobacteria bacterium]|nr:family 10 glycosylhydrolase [Acidobacteriota bacterium]